jgi:hypothetical protein
MPGFDGTGPLGMGPMTGGGRGWCYHYSPLNAGLAAPAMYARPMMPPSGAWGSPYQPAYAGLHGGFGGYPFRPFGMGMGWRMGRGRGMGLGRGIGRGFWGADRGRWW